MKYNLSNISIFPKEKVEVLRLTKNTYISTENMLPNRGGVQAASTLPSIEQTQAFRRGDVLVSNIRPYFKKIWQAKWDGGCSNDVLVFRASEETCPEFLYYVLSDDKFFNYATTTSKGTKMPRGDKVAIMRYEIPKFRRTEQEKIAGCLRVIDEKIELNSEINHNLQQQAQVLFAKFFLDIPNIPAGWRKGNLLDIANYLNGLAMQKLRPKEGEKGLPVLKIKELRQGFCDFDSELCSPHIRSDYLVHDGDIIFSWSGSLLVDFWCGGDCGLNQHLFKVTSSKYEPWFFYLWTNYHLSKFVAIAADKATTMGHIKREDLAKSEVLIPSVSDYEKIGDAIRPLISMVVNNRIENRRLAILRDTLLPKLMSGEIDVSEVEI